MTMQRQILTLADAKKRGLRNRLTSACRIAEAHAGALDGFVRDSIRAGRPAAIVIVKSNQPGQWVEVWNAAEPLTGQRRYANNYRMKHSMLQPARALA